MPKMLRLNGLTEYWEGLSGRIWNVEDDCTTCDILIAINKMLQPFIDTYLYSK